MVVELLIAAVYFANWPQMSVPVRIIIFLLVCIGEVLFEKHIDTLEQWMDNYDKQSN
jgi:hypothetical protein